MAPRQGVLGSTNKKHRNIFKNLLCQNHMAQIFESWYVALPSGPLPSLFNCRSQGSRWPLARCPRSKENIETIKNLLFQNHLAYMFEIWYVALPSGRLPSLFK